MTTTDLTKYGVEVFDTPLVVGEFVRGRNTTYGSDWGGTYRGIRASEWTGEPVHVIEDGYIRDTPQTVFTILVAAVSENSPA